MKPRPSIANRIADAAAVLDATLQDEKLLTALSAYEYDQARLEEGQALLTAARAAQRLQEKEHSAEAAAVDARRAATQHAQDTYMHDLKVARVALREQRSLKQKLGLTGKREKAITRQIEQMSRFYEHALGDEAALAALARYGITREKLQAGQAAVEATHAAFVERERRKGEAQDATQERDAAFRPLQRWLHDFLSIARVALEDHPQQLEKLGLVIR